MASPHVRELLIPILQESTRLLASGISPNKDALLKRLEEVKTEAGAQMANDRGVATSFVEAVNLLVDSVRGCVDVSKVRDAVTKLDAADGWNTALPLDLLRNGTVVKLSTGGTSPMGTTVVNWSGFLRNYARQFGYNPYSAREVDQLWLDMVAGSLSIPVADLNLADPTGGTSTWVTDDTKDGRTLRTGDPQRDVYDAVGLDWQPPNSRTRAVLICCRMSVRAVAAGSLNCPTAVDGWGNLLFVPRHPTLKPWPDHGAATARPTSDDPSLPEAIHGPAKVGYKSASVHPVHELNVGDRVTQYGLDVMNRAIVRLRASLS